MRAASPPASSHVGSLPAADPLKACLGSGLASGGELATDAGSLSRSSPVIRTALNSRYLKWCGLCFAVAALTITELAGCSSGTGRSTDNIANTDDPVDDLTLFLSQYAPPDSDDTTAYDTPRPPLVTRWLVYSREGVRVIYIANGKVGAPPPYTWRLLGFTQDGTHEPLAADEALRLLANRRAK